MGEDLRKTVKTAVKLKLKKVNNLSSNWESKLEL